MDKQITCAHCKFTYLLSEAVDLEFEFYKDNLLYFCNMSCLQRFKLIRESETKVSRTLFTGDYQKYTHKCVNCFKTILNEQLMFIDQIGNRDIFYCDIACHIIFEKKGFQMLQ